MWDCVYAHSRLTPDQVSDLEHLKELNLYTCGSSLYSSDDCFIVVREALVCSSPIEAQYSGAALVSFPPICYHCGLDEESLVNNDYIQELKGFLLMSRDVDFHNFFKTFYHAA